MNPIKIVQNIHADPFSIQYMDLNAGCLHFKTTGFGSIEIFMLNNYIHKYIGTG
ncbi:MAG: hypothetical protein NMNS01_28470 [Nitrosomonas sp.]|nr:MAG: hypothetical protein NMNS01_28470 [Nitrosomonas sp.]